MENQEAAPEQVNSNNISADYKFLSKIFIEILMAKNETFKNTFQAAAPDVYADIESFYGNKNCSCRGKVEKYIMSNKEKSAELLNNFIAENGGENHTLFDIENIEKKYKNPLERRIPQPTRKGNEIINYIDSLDDALDNIYSGKTELVKITEWGNYVKNLRSKDAKFFQFSTVKVDDETIRVFFL
jgi:hypothetical protein